MIKNLFLQSDIDKCLNNLYLGVTDVKKNVQNIKPKVLTQ